MDHNQINAALAAASGTWELPPGPHQVFGQIAVPSGKRLLGMQRCPAPWQGMRPGVGSYLDVLWGDGPGSCGDVSRAAIICGAGGTVEGVGFNYPGQDINSAPLEWGSAIMAVDYAHGGLSMSVIDCMFNKAYVGVDFRGSKTGQGIVQAKVIGNYGAPLHTGLWFDFMVDWCVIRDNMFNSGMIDPASGFLAPSALKLWVASNGTVVRLGGCDWATLDNIQAWGYKCGVEIKGGDGYAATGPYRIRNSSFDACLYGIYVNNTVFYNQVITSEGNNFVAWHPYTHQRGISMALPGVAGRGLMFRGNYSFGPQQHILEMPNTNMGLVTVLDNQGDCQLANPNDWLAAAGSSSPMNVNYNRFV